MIKDNLKVRELLKVKSIVSSVKQENMPFFLSTLISKINELDAFATKIYPSEEEENKNALKTIDDFEKLVNIPFSSEIKSKAIDLFKKSREARVERFSKFIHTHSTLYTYVNLLGNKDLEKNNIIKKNISTNSLTHIHFKRYSSGKNIDSNEGNVR